MLQAPMRIGLGGLLGWLVPVGVATGLVGAWPTWHLAGQTGLVSLGLAGGIVLAAVFFSALVVIGLAYTGPSRAAVGFVVSGLLRLAGCVGLGWMLLPVLPVCALTFYVWLAVFYLVGVVAEGAWLARALRRDSERVSLGEIRRPSRHMWNRHRIR